MKVGIIGGSGYGGGELLRILLFHQNVEVSAVTSRPYAGEFVFRVHPNLRGLTQLKFVKPDPEAIANTCDLVFTSLPHGASVKFVPLLLELGLKVIDLGADFRLKDPKDYEIWYGWKHERPELLERAVFGLPELHRDEIKNADLVACPGCMANASILGLAPLIKAGVVDRDRIVVDAKMGTSGAGAKPTPAGHHPEKYNSIRAYKPVGHRHTAEIIQELSSLGGKRVSVSFSAHSVNMARGILATIHAFHPGDLKEPDIWRIYRSAYQGEPFIRLVKDRKALHGLPDPKNVMGSNFCDIGFELDPHSNRLVVLSAIDNLVKGAAGTAVHCMNIMMGFDEREGLMLPPLRPL